MTFAQRKCLRLSAPLAVQILQVLHAARSPLSVRLLTNPSRFDSILATGRIIGLLHAYQREELTSRLSAAGLSAEMLNVLDIEQENIGRAAGPAERAVLWRQARS